MKPYAALYERLSKEESGSEESASIRHQKELLETYAKSHGYPDFRHFTDDGYSGTSLRRPAIQALMEEIKKGRVSAVIVRDLSRLGRNYLETGQLTEEFFPRHHVRFLALMEEVDLKEKNDAELSPLINLINDWYSRELSRKTRLAAHQLQQQGRRQSRRAVYGYLPDPDRPYEWIPDPVAGLMVRRILRLLLEGETLTNIAGILNEESLPAPQEYARTLGVRKGMNPRNPYPPWKPVTILRILQDPQYSGTKVLRRIRNNYGHGIRLPEEEWIRFPGSHEPLIREENLRVVRDRHSRYKPQAPHPFLSLTSPPPLFRCAECGLLLYPGRWAINKPALEEPSNGCPAPRLALPMPVTEGVVAMLTELVFSSLEDRESLCRSLTRMREENEETVNNACRLRLEQLKAHRRRVLEQCERLYEASAAGTVDEALIRPLSDLYEEELKRLDREARTVRKRMGKECPPVTEPELRRIILSLIFAFVDTLWFHRDPEGTPQRTRTYPVEVELRVDLPGPLPPSFTRDGYTLNFTWKLPGTGEDAASVLRRLAEDMLIL